jgi:hypothetical protein
MGDYVIQARFEAACPREQVLRWLSSVDGIAGWWSDTVSGSAAKSGDGFTVRFPTTDVPFELVVGQGAEGQVVWDVPESPPWWAGTTIKFELAASEDGGSSLLFTHGGFDPSDPIIAVITPAWVGFLNNLVAVAESGEAHPAVVN